MIQSFRNKALRRLFETGSARGLSVPDDRRLGRMLAALDDAGSPDDVDIPGYRFHSLTGIKRDGTQ